MRFADTALLPCLLLALVACSGEKTPDAAPAAAAEPSAAETAATPAAPPVPPTDSWLFREFDWGDTKEIVYESVDYTPGFICYRHKLRENCVFVKTRVDGEELLANFYFVDDKLYRADILTPDLDEAQATEHLERVWKLLAAYVTRMQGAASEQTEFGDWKALTPGQIRVTHRWVQPTQEIRVVVGRSQDDASGWFTAVRAVDPKWAHSEPAFGADTKK